MDIQATSCQELQQEQALARLARQVLASMEPFCKEQLALLLASVPLRSAALAVVREQRVAFFVAC